MTELAVVAIISPALHTESIQQICYQVLVVSVKCVLWLSGRTSQLGEGALDESQLKSSILSQLLNSLSWASCVCQGSTSSKVAINSNMLSTVLWQKTLHADMYVLQICNITLPPHTHTNSALNMLSQQKVVKKSAENN